MSRRGSKNNFKVSRAAVENEYPLEEQRPLEEAITEGFIAAKRKGIGDQKEA